jgi:glutamate/tyrosine decarboxylase-like PLP-dependent enzyme
VIEQLVAAVEPALVASAGPRYYGFVVGGSLEAATRADILAAGWDQMAFNSISSPVAFLVEEIVAGWLKEALALPPDASFGLVTGAQGANTVALAAARHRVLSEAAWDVEAEGLVGAPAVRVLAGEERHATIDRSLRLLGLGANALEPVAAGGNGAIEVDALARALEAGDGDPTIVCAQAGNVNSGAFDPIDAIADLTAAHGAWLHIDGAFGLWAAASDALRHHVRGIERADSCATDAHKWLNVTYDSGLVFTAHPAAHRAAMSMSAAYLTRSPGEPREPMDWTPESSRRARGFAVYAALASLGRSGVAELVERCCRLARRFADRLRQEPAIEILNEVVLNQVLVRVAPPGGDADAATQEALRLVQEERVCWLGGSRWHGMDAMRISVSNWSTDEADVDRSVAAVLRCMREAG